MERRFSQLRWKDRLRIEKMLKEGAEGPGDRRRSARPQLHHLPGDQAGADVAADERVGRRTGLLPGDRRAEVPGEYAGQGAGLKNRE